MLFRNAALTRQKAKEARDPLAYERTVLANERTLLAYVRTALAFLGAGVGLLEFSRSGLMTVAGWIFLLLGGLILAAGFKSYHESQARIDDNASEQRRQNHDTDQPN